MGNVPGEVWTGLAALLTGLGVHFTHKIRTANRVRNGESVTTHEQFDRKWAQRMAARASDLVELERSISLIAHRVGQVEKWKDGHDADERKAGERLAVVEQQYRAISMALGEAREFHSESQQETRAMLERIMEMVGDGLRDTRERLLALERSRGG